jgi:CDP-paratose 2-epimerase
MNGSNVRPLRAAAKPVVITGGAGFLGANLADRLAREGTPVLVFDSLARPGVRRNLAWLEERHHGGVRVRIGDVRDAAAMADTLRDARAVCHLAAQVAVTTSLEDPVADFEINARGTLNVLEALRAQAEPPPLLFASTNKVYGRLLPAEALERGETRWEPRDPERRKGCAEATPLDLYSPYGCSKGVADQYVLDYARVFGLPTLVFRMSCLYGPRQFGNEDQGWIAHFLIRALNGEPITVYGDGRQVRDALYVDDAVGAWLLGLREVERLRGRAFNLGGGPGHTLSLLELLQQAERLAGAGPEVRFGEARPGDQLWYVSDTTAFEMATGWRAKVGVADGLKRLAGWLRGNVVAAPQSPARREVRA